MNIDIQKFKNKLLKTVRYYDGLLSKRRLINSSTGYTTTFSSAILLNNIIKKLNSSHEIYCNNSVKNIFKDCVKRISEYDSIFKNIPFSHVEKSIQYSLMENGYYETARNSIINEVKSKARLEFYI